MALVCRSARGRIRPFAVRKSGGQPPLYEQDGKEIAIGKSKSDDFRKTDASGRGYQPMVYGLKSAQITEDNQLVRFRFQFQKGLEREFIYRVEKEKS